jgi:glycosyltransferase involved in cell wall biosynthesis
LENIELLRIAEEAKRMLSGSTSVYIYQYLFFDTKGETCFNDGAERYLRDLAELIAKLGKSVTLIQLGDESSCKIWRRSIAGMEVLGLPCSFFDYPKVAELLPAAPLNIYSGYLNFGKLHHPNILISHGVTWDRPDADANVSDLRLRLEGVETLVSADTNTLSYLRSVLEKSLCAQLPHFLHIPNYVDLERFKPSENKAPDDKSIHIVFSRRAVPERGFWLVSDVLPKILQKYPNVTFDFVGNTDSEDIIRNIDDLVTLWGGRVRHLTLEADEMPAVYQGADISVVPTLCSEGASLSVLEAMACGSAVICTNVGDLPNPVVDGFNGLMISPNTDELYTAMTKLIEDDELRKALVKNALGTVKCFSKSLWDERWTNLLQKKLSNPQPETAEKHTRILAVTCSLYRGDAYHGYFNALYWAKQNGWIVLAPENYINSPLEYPEWAFQIHDMEAITEQERLSIPQMYFPESLFIQSEEDPRSWTERNLDLFSCRNAELEDSLQAQIDEYLRKNPDTQIDSVLMYSESYPSLRHVAAKYGAKVLNYDFSTIRKHNGFTQSLIMCSTDGKPFYRSYDARDRYDRFIVENGNVVQFSRRELIALFYLLPSFPMIPLLDAPARDEMGVCLGGGLPLPIFSGSKYTDEDVLREVTEVYSFEQLPLRYHPAAVSQRIAVNPMPENPVPFLLSNRRIAASASNTLFEAMLWNRTAYCRGMNLPFTFACTKHPAAGDIVDERFLNWFLFGYCIPGYFELFSEGYWRWRERRPTETEIYKYHQSVILDNLGVTEDILALPEEERFARIMELRKYMHAAQKLLLERWKERESLRPVYDHLQSYLHILDSEEYVYAKYEGINLETDNGISTCFPMEDDSRRRRVEFCPLQESAGFVRILSVRGGECTYKVPPQYCNFCAMEPYATIPISGDGIERGMVLEIIWETKELSSENCNAFLKANKTWFERFKSVLKEKIK